MKIHNTQNTNTKIVHISCAKIQKIVFQLWGLPANYLHQQVTLHLLPFVLYNCISYVDLVYFLCISIVFEPNSGVSQLITPSNK